MVAAVAAPVARIAGSVQFRRGAAIKAAAPMRVARRSAVRCEAVSSGGRGKVSNLHRPFSRRIAQRRPKKVYKMPHLKTMWV